MSKFSVTICDGCRKKITGELNEPQLGLVIYVPLTKMTGHYCYDCSAAIFNIMKDLAANKDGEKE